MTTIVPLTRYNWESCLEIELTPEQTKMTPTVLYSLAQAHFEQLHAFGIMTRGTMVGFLMYGEFGGICWINRIMVDKKYQRQGIGRAALLQLLSRLQMKYSCKEIRTSYAVNNYSAARFFEGLGFFPMDSSLKEEIVAVYKK